MLGVEDLGRSPSLKTFFGTQNGELGSSVTYNPLQNCLISTILQLEYLDELSRARGIW